jgi:hypothetical protein
LNICGTISRSHRFRSTNTSRRAEPTANKWYQFFAGTIVQLAGISQSDVKTFNTCVPDGWRVADSSKSSEESQAESTEQKSVWTEILDGVQKVLEFICKFKDNIKKLFTRKMRRLNRKNNYRMFMQRYSRSRGWWSNVTNKVKSVFGSVADLIKKTWDKVTGFAGEVVTNLRTFYQNIRRVVTYLTSPDFKAKVQLFMSCVMVGKGLVMGLIGFVKGAIVRIQGMIAAGAAPPIIAGYVIDFICKFPDFRVAIGFLIDGIKNPDTLQKFFLIGQFLGKLAKTILNKRRH